jgi:hypothetical protein
MSGTIFFFSTMVSGSAARRTRTRSQSTTHIHLVGHLTYIPWRSQGNHHYIYSRLNPLILKLRSKSSARLFRKPHRWISNPHYPCHRSYHTTSHPPPRTFSPSAHQIITMAACFIGTSRASWFRRVTQPAPAKAANQSGANLSQMKSAPL